MKQYELKRRDYKILISGDIVEVYEYRIPINVEHREHEIIKGTKKDDGKRQDNLRRARTEIRRYIWNNITPYSKFITLTYKDSNLDYNKLVEDFKYFIKKLNRAGYKNLKWLYVTEHQKERGQKEGNEGSLHIHCVLFIDEYIPYQIINEAWGLGGTDIHKIDNINNVGAYVCKYLTKDEFDIFEKNSYHISRGLKKPEEIVHEGYITDPDFAKEILEKTDFYFSDVINYSYDSFDGSRFDNTIFYKQGRLRQDK